MLFMVIERFKRQRHAAHLQRVRDEGRMLPEGLRYIDSWVEPNFSRCFQLMECDDLRLLQEWRSSARDSASTLGIVRSCRAGQRDVVAPYLDKI